MAGTFWKVVKCIFWIFVVLSILSFPITYLFTQWIESEMYFDCLKMERDYNSDRIEEGLRCDWVHFDCICIKDIRGCTLADYTAREVAKELRNE